MRNKQLSIVVGDESINILKINQDDYISLTDMVKNHGGSALIEKWLSSKDTIEFLGVWERMNNPDFNSPEFGGIKNEAGTNRFTLSVKRWVNTTGAIGVRAKTGRYASGTFAHRDIAFEFATYISPEFKLMFIKDYDRLKTQEAEQVQWDLRRLLTKTNYRVQTSAISEALSTATNMSTLEKSLIYATEADILNKIVFGQTASEWKVIYPALAKSGDNQRDQAPIEQLLVMTHLESINANLINRGIGRSERIKILADEAEHQKKVLLRNEPPTARLKSR
jgi:hypothetical protein